MCNATCRGASDPSGNLGRGARDATKVSLTARRCLPRLKRRHQWCPRQSRPQASLRAGAPRIQAPLSMSARRQEVIRQSRLIVHSHRADRVWTDPSSSDAQSAWSAVPLSLRMLAHRSYWRRPPPQAGLRHHPNWRGLGPPDPRWLVSQRTRPASVPVHALESVESVACPTPE